MKTVIRNVDITISPSASFRTTKGGKRILLDNPFTIVTVLLTIDKIQRLRNRDLVMMDGCNYCYIENKENATLRNVTLIQYQTMHIANGIELEIVFLGRRAGEAPDYVR